MDAEHKAITQAMLAQYGADSRIFCDMRQATLPDGGRIIDAYNVAGLHFTFLPDRGLDIWTARYRGVPLTWISPGAPHLPDFGRNWLQQFNGGLLATCGLTHAGPPETDPDTGEERGIHGQYSRLRAQDVRIERDDDYLELHGTIWETSLFGTQLALRRTYRLPFVSPMLTIRDTVTNHGDVPAPLMLVYHLNFGFPLIRAGTEMVVASEVYPRDADARAGYARWASYDAPSVDYPEQVFFHRPMMTQDGTTAAALIHETFGVVIRWDATTLPYLTQWKNTRQTHYVCGIEPGTCVPEGQNAARAANRLTTLEPGESRDFRVEIGILKDITAFKDEIKTIRTGGRLAGDYTFDEFKP